MQHPQNLQEKRSTVPAETLPSNLEECFLCENQASRAHIHQAMTMQLIYAPLVCTELARPETFSKIKMCDQRTKVSSCMPDIVAQQGKIQVKDEKTQTQMVRSIMLFLRS